MTWPARYGGGDRTFFERYVVTEELLAAGAPVSAHWIADRQSGPLLLRYGTEAQRQRLLSAITRGECFFDRHERDPIPVPTCVGAHERQGRYRRLCRQRHEGVDDGRAP